MKLTRRAFVGKLPFGIAGLWAMVRGKHATELDRPSWLANTGECIGKCEVHGVRLYPREALSAAVDEFWQKETGQPYEFPRGHTYYCSSDGDYANDGLTPESAVPWKKALELVEVNGGICWLGLDGNSVDYERTA